MNEMKLYRKIGDLKLGQEFRVKGSDEILRRPTKQESIECIGFFSIIVFGNVEYILASSKVELVLSDRIFDTQIEWGDFFYHENKKFRRIYIVYDSDGKKFNAYCLDNNLLYDFTGKTVQVISGDKEG